MRIRIRCFSLQGPERNVIIQAYKSHISLMYKISEEMDEIIGSAQEDKTDKTFEVKNLNSNQMVGSVLFQREISEKDSVGFCETPALFFDEQDDFDIAENNFCPINM